MFLARVSESLALATVEKDEEQVAKYHYNPKYYVEVTPTKEVLCAVKRPANLFYY